MRTPLFLAALLFSGCAGHSQTVAPAAPGATELAWKVMQAFPHDPGAFTEGLLWHNGSLYESTGLEGQSTLRRVDLATGQVVQERDLNPKVFGEGLAFANNKLYQLTWQSHIGYVYNATTFQPESTFSYEDEGWGLTYNGKELVQSDGTDVLTFRDPATFRSLRTVAVTWNGQPVKMLNELEAINGQIWANVWQTDDVVIIDPATGRVTSYLDFTGLLPREDRTGHEDVLNGIAFDAATQRVFITGKNWSKLFWVKVGN